MIKYDFQALRDRAPHRIDEIDAVERWFLANPSGHMRFGSLACAVMDANPDLSEYIIDDILVEVTDDESVFTHTYRRLNHSGGLEGEVLDGPAQDLSRIGGYDLVPFVKWGDT